VVRWNSLKAKAVFQYLLMHDGRPVRRDVLMGLQWPDHTVPPPATQPERGAVQACRKTLDGPWPGLQPILYRDGCYVLNPDVKWWIDRDEFLSTLSRRQ